MASLWRSPNNTTIGYTPKLTFTVKPAIIGINVFYTMQYDFIPVLMKHALVKLYLIFFSTINGYTKNRFFQDNNKLILIFFALFIER